jgi:hypothetical protein
MESEKHAAPDCCRSAGPALRGSTGMMSIKRKGDGKATGKSPSGYGMSHWWELTGRERARLAKARNVRAGGADPHRRRGNIGYGLPTTENL